MSDPVLYILLGVVAALMAAVLVLLILLVRLAGRLDTRVEADVREAVHRGLGEMQELARGVDDLRRVLSNVKARGT